MLYSCGTSFNNCSKNKLSFSVRGAIITGCRYLQPVSFLGVFETRREKITHHLVENLKRICHLFHQAFL
jgi:hypothetical protein